MTVKKRITCCDEIADRASTAVDDSILEEMMVTDYYDGPIGGFIRCPTCRREYYFITLDYSQDPFVRVISLAEVPRGSWERLTDFFGEAPTRKKWVPTLLHRASEEDLDRIEPFVANLASQAEEPSIVLAWNVSNVSVVAARRTNPGVARYLLPIFQGGGSSFDWFAYLDPSRSDGSSPVRAAETAVTSSREDLLRRIAESPPEVVAATTGIQDCPSWPLP